MPLETGHLIIYRASRLEALLEPLRLLMASMPPPSVLTPHEVVAAHPGLGRWLRRALAREAGPGGIAANLAIELPGAWLDRLAREVLGTDAVDSRPYRREVLRWRIHEALAELEHPELTAYLEGAAGGRDRRRFELAERVARVFTQYMVYRPDWLEAWRHGRDPIPDAGFLAPLWRLLRGRIGTAHRGERRRELIEALARAPAGLREDPLHLFGVAHLAPAELEVFHALARHRPVVLYVPDPCREYWGGLRSDRAALRAAVEAAPASDATEHLFLEQGHPLLAAWGRLGQHFMLALDGLGALEDTRHRADQREADACVRTRLAGVQESIRRFEPGLIGEHAPLPREDATLRVHACHTRLRELEVLRDALLAARRERPQLRPADMVVVMPDIAAYLPLIPAVFGEAGKHAGPLPYHLADVATARMHPLFEAFRRVLELATTRISAPAVADLLALDPVARRYGIGADEAVQLGNWLAESRTAWGLDADARAGFGVPAIAEHTFAWGLERMLAGYLAGGDGKEDALLELPAGDVVAPLAGVSGPQAALLGSLDALLVELAALAARAREVHPASFWAEWLAQRVEALFAVDFGDRAGRTALGLLRRFIGELAGEPASAGLDPELDFGIVRKLLLDRLDAVPAEQRFLLGGLTFCAMVPQRSIPFELVAVLGLNDGEFPRALGDGGIDPMLRHPRSGDRGVRADDRYLFLETVMAARWRLHLSYVGQGANDGKPRNPAAPLAELMAALDAGCNVRREAPQGEGEEEKWLRLRPWWVRHPLQPFAAAYFDDSDPALASFRAEFARMQPGRGTPPPPFLVEPGRGDVAAPAATAPVALGELLAYFRNPAKQLLAGRLNLRLDALAEDRLADSEPLADKFQPIDTVGRRLFLRAVATHPHALPDAPPAWLRLTGLLPPGRAGEAAWLSEQAKVRELLEAVAQPAHPAAALFSRPLPEARPLLLDFVVGPHCLAGELREVYRSGDSSWVLAVHPKRTEAALTFKERIDLFLRWALVRLASDPARAVLPALLTKPARQKPGEPIASQLALEFMAWDIGYREASPSERRDLRADLERRVTGLVDFFLASQRHPQWYFPKTSWLALAGDPAGAAKAWEGEGSYAPGYERQLAGERDFSDAADFAALRAAAETLQALISLTRVEEAA